MKYYLKLFLYTNLISIMAFLVFRRNFSEAFSVFTYLFIFLAPICLVAVFYSLLVNSYFSKIVISSGAKETYILFISFLFFLVLNSFDVLFSVDLDFEINSFFTNFKNEFLSYWLIFVVGQFLNYLLHTKRYTI